MNTMERIEPLIPTGPSHPAVGQHHSIDSVSHDIPLKRQAGRGLGFLGIVVVCVGLIVLAVATDPVYFRRVPLPNSDTVHAQQLGYSLVAPYPCTDFLHAYGTSQFSSLSEVLVAAISSRPDGGLGSAANIISYIATECRLHEEITIGQAVENLFAQKRSNELPQIPIGGATEDPHTQSTWEAFDRWIHHRGPRPQLGSSTIEMGPKTPSVAQNFDAERTQSDARSSRAAITTRRTIDPSLCTNGVASTSTQECNRAKQRALSEIRIQENASSAMLEYEDLMMPVQRALQLAVLAGMCRLRSERYVQSIINSANILAQREVDRLHLSAAEMSAADAEAKRVLRQERDVSGPEPIDQTCRKLTNSPEIDRLDDLQRKLVGNYH